MSQTVQQADDTETPLESTWENTGENTPHCEFIDQVVENTILMCFVLNKANAMLNKVNDTPNSLSGTNHSL